MGQQQILLIIIGVILIAIAVGVGAQLFRDQAVDANQDDLRADLIWLAEKAFKYRMMTIVMGGGSGSYLNITERDLGSSDVLDNDHGSFELISVEADEVVIQATGKIGNTPWIIQCVVDGSGNKTITVVQTASF